MDWISVKNELPVREKSVLIFTDDGEIHTAEFCSWNDTCDVWHISFGKNTHEPLCLEQKEVTHWMPLPDKPQTDG